MGRHNFFSNYTQEENHFTNGLLSLFRLSAIDGPHFINSLLSDELSLAPPKKINDFRVLQQIDGTADAELSGDNCRIRFETKIVSRNLSAIQIQSHLEHLQKFSETLKRVVLLTPDDSKSQYILSFLAIDKEHLLHLEWKSVYNYLKKWISNRPATMFTEVVGDFLERIHGRVFEEDFAGVIAKVAFGEHTGVVSATYLDEMRNGDWKHWNTPRQYQALDGKRRKLLLYDGERKAITVEVEIAMVSQTNFEPDYPWTNFFVPDNLSVLNEPISLKRIEAILGFSNFGKERSAFRNITHQQYRRLTSTFEIITPSDDPSRKAPELP